MAELLRWNGGRPAAHCQKASLWAWMEFLSGNPSESGDFHFIVTVSDSDHPAHQRNQELALRVLAPRNTMNKLFLLSALILLLFCAGCGAGSSSSGGFGGGGTIPLASLTVKPVTGERK